MDGEVLELGDAHNVVTVCIHALEQSLQLKSLFGALILLWFCQDGLRAGDLSLALDFTQLLQDRIRPRAFQSIVKGVKVHTVRFHDIRRERSPVPPQQQPKCQRDSNGIQQYEYDVEADRPAVRGGRAVDIHVANQPLLIMVEATAREEADARCAQA